jgi:GntP family gluconate:H+ symporter
MNTVPGLSREASLLLVAGFAVFGLIFLVARCKLNSFIALTVAALFVGLCSGRGLLETVQAFQEGLGKVLADIAMVVALGTILGKMLAESGGAERIASTLLRALGEARAPWTMLLVGFLVGLPVFFAVGLVLLAPIAFTIARNTRTPLLRLGLPLVAGLSVAHGLVPPHPGPMAAIGLLNASGVQADVGKVIFYSLLIGLPTAVVAGPIFGHLTTKHVQTEATTGIAAQGTPAAPAHTPPSVGLTVLTVLLPIGLMLLASAAQLALDRQNPLRPWLEFAGHPMVALLLAVLLSFYVFGIGRGFSKEQVLQFSADCLAPVATILLVVGAGGGFSRVLVHSGAADAMATLAKGTHLSPLLLGWLMAALIRVATGSATVAITAAAGLIAPLAAQAPEVDPALLVLAMGAGSLILSHVNDGGFWLVKEYLGLTVPQTLKTWTVMETLISVVALALILALDRFV